MLGNRWTFGLPGWMLDREVIPLSSMQAPLAAMVRNHPVRFGFGVVVSVVAALLTAFLVWVIVDFVSNTWIEGEAEFYRFMFGVLGSVVSFLWIIGVGLIVLSRQQR